VLNSLAGLLGNETLTFEGSVAQGAIRFLTFWVIVPVLLGASLRAVLRESHCQRVLFFIKGVNPILLLLLNYSNASLSLPAMFRQSEQGTLLLVLLLSTALCAINFGSAAMLARLGRFPRPVRISLLLGIGMRNNGAGLVLGDAPPRNRHAARHRIQSSAACGRGTDRSLLLPVGGMYQPPFGHRSFAMRGKIARRESQLNSEAFRKRLWYTLATPRLRSPQPGLVCIDALFFRLNWKKRAVGATPFGPGD